MEQLDKCLSYSDIRFLFQIPLLLASFVTQQNWFLTNLFWKAQSRASPGCRRMLSPGLKWGQAACVHPPGRTWTCLSVPLSPNPPSCKMWQLAQAGGSWVALVLNCLLATWYGKCGRSFSTCCELSLNNCRPRGWASRSCMWKTPGARAHEWPSWASESTHSQVCSTLRVSQSSLTPSLLS